MITRTKMKLTCTTKSSLPSIVNSIKSIATKLPVKVIVASVLLISATGSMAMDSFVLTAPSYAKTASKPKVSKAKKPVITQSAVKFKDAALEKAIRQQLDIGDKPLTLNVLQGIKVLNLGEAGITSLEGIQALRNLTTLNLCINKISDVKPLAGLTKLTDLSLCGNPISDVKPLAGLTKLTMLDLRGNPISDVKPLAGLTKLTKLSLDSNEISNVKPLAGLTKLTYLDLSSNPISDVESLAVLTKIPDF